MPPKKQQEQPSTPIITWTILPIVFNSPLALQALKKPVTIKKVIDKDKLIQLLKQKGVDKYLQEGKLNRQGQIFLSQNMHTIGQQYLVQCRKPADPKKDAKKDNKKDSKKEEVVVEEGQKPIEYDFAKGVTQFLFYVDVPLDSEILQISMKNGLNPEIVVWIEEQVKEGSQKPDYTLLNNTRSIEDFMGQMNSTSPEKKQVQRKSEDINQQKEVKRQVIRKIQKTRMNKDSPLQNTIIIQVPYLKDLQHPETDCQEFLSSLFKKICELSLKKQEFQNWKKQQKITTMVPIIKQTVKKEVVVEQKKDEKKGKKDPAAQPVTQIVEEVIERKYQSFPQNIRSDLVTYKRISNQRKKQPNTSIYWKMLDDLAHSVSNATEPHEKVQNFKEESMKLWAKYKNKPLNKVKIQNLRDKLPEVRSSPTSDELTYQINLKSHQIPAEVTLLDLKKQSPTDCALEYEYKLEQFTQLSKALGDRILYEFDDRKYVEKLSAKEVNSRINQYIERDPKIYYGDCVNDAYNLMILARVNPPGRTLYKNHIFDWRVLPNFQFWSQNCTNSKDGFQFWDYNWRQSGNLKVLSKKLMPTDNSVLAQTVYCCGDNQNRMINLSKDNVEYGLHQIKGGNHLLWKNYHDLKTMVYTQSDDSCQKKQDKNASIQICIQRKQFTVLFNPDPTICWHNHELELSRTFGSKGELTKRMKDGSLEIFYPNGDISFLKFGSWTHIKGCKISCETSQQQKELKMDCKVETDKQIKIREDQTIFIKYSNNDRSVVFKDGTVIRKSNKNKIQIKNPNNVVIRILLARQKDFNVIGAGSAFAYLGNNNLLQRSYDGGLYELHHPTFSWHSYTEGIDRSGKISLEQVVLIAYPDKSIMKIGDNGMITFLNKAKETNEEYLSERWIQLFTSPEYHLEGVYDVDLIQGQIRTRDAESNFFKVRIDGTGISEIAVSFNIGSLKDEKNSFGQGLHVPEQNYFLPPPQNSITPKLFLINPDGTGEQYLTEQQIEELQCWKAVSSTCGGRNIIQYCRQVTPECQYLCHSFSQKVNLSAFTLPNLLQDIAVRPTNICYDYHTVEFRSLEKIDWNTDFQKVRQNTSKIQQKRKALADQLEALRKKVQ